MSLSISILDLLATILHDSVGIAMNTGHSWIHGACVVDVCPSWTRNPIGWLTPAVRRDADAVRVRKVSLCVRVCVYAYVYICGVCE